ncbi:MAG TPA: hypothetical protein VI341_06020 [Actinomycetota bacterium]
MGIVLVIVAAAFSVVAIDAVVESARVDARDIILFGHTLMSPGTPAGPWILIGLVAAAVLAWTAVTARSRGRGLERRMAEELDARRDLPPRRGVSERSSGTTPGATRHLFELRTSSSPRISDGTSGQSEGPS